MQPYTFVPCLQVNKSVFYFQVNKRIANTIVFQTNRAVWLLFGIFAHAIVTILVSVNSSRNNLRHSFQENANKQQNKIENEVGCLLIKGNGVRQLLSPKS
jgi:hypothetical protein